MDFMSPTQGKLTFDEVFNEVVGYVAQYPGDRFNLIIGTDSQMKHDTCFVTALIVHRKGKGGRFFYTRKLDFYSRSLRQRIFYEASLSLKLAALVIERLAQVEQNLDIEIHMDVGSNGATKEIVKEVVGMVIGSGFSCRIKPDAYGASTVADKFTK